MSAREHAWQRDDGRTGAVLHEVLAWLEARDLARAGAVCRAWRRAAAAPALWRRLLSRHAPATALPPAAECRQQVVWQEAGWHAAGREALDAVAVHGALHADGARLALLTEDALQLWELRDGRWTRTWSEALASRGWRSGVRVHWPPRGERLLVAGALALVDAWELLVLEAGVPRVLARARCTPGAAGCWADAAGDAFLSLELSVLAPRLACTTVWLNASSQETKSEYVGVRTPLLRIFNEDAEHISWVEVAEVTLTGGDTCGVLVAAQGCGRGGGALATWALAALRPPPLLAAELGSLRERVARRARRPPSPEEPAPPDESAVRALCEEPLARCVLPAPPLGLAVSSGTVWASLQGGAAYWARLPALTPLHVLVPPAAAPRAEPALLHYVQPSVSDVYFVSPAGGGSGGVLVWRRAGGTARAPPAAPAPALAALLCPARPPHPPRLLVLAGETLYVNVAQPRNSAAGRDQLERDRLECGKLERGPLVWHSPDGHTHARMASLALRYLRLVPARALSRSCGGPHAPTPPPCAPAPRPACRPRPPPLAPCAQRVVCCAPPQGARLPCAPPAPTAGRTCADATSGVRTRCIGGADEVRCGAEQDRVARRLAAAAAARRANYEREAGERRPAPLTTYAPYTLGAGGVCARATDGRTYSLPSAPPARRCGPHRTPPSPEYVPLRAHDACRPSDGRLDPCQHRPRVFLEVDRSAQPLEPPAAGRAASTRHQCGHARRGLHSSAASWRDAADAGGGGLDAALRSRADLAEAGRGRVAARCDGQEPAPPGPAGRLELPVPPGAERVTVSVAVAPGRPRSAPTPCGVPPRSPPPGWLSIKSLQRRFAAGRRAGADDCGCPPAPSAVTAPPPAPSAVTAPAPASQSRTAPTPTAPKRKSPCDNKEQSDLKDTKKKFSNLKFLSDTFLLKS